MKGGRAGGKNDRDLVLGDGTRIPVLYEDRNVLAVDKPAGWMLAPSGWTQTRRNLQLALESAIRSHEPWARRRQLRFLRYIHRLDAETSGLLLLARSPGALKAMTALFMERRVEKVYLAVCRGPAPEAEWLCECPLEPHPRRKGLMRAAQTAGTDKEAATRFRLLATNEAGALVEARPLSGRTHQIRVHLRESAGAVLGDALYGDREEGAAHALALRAVGLAYPDPFSGRWIRIGAPADAFLRHWGFSPGDYKGPAFELKGGEAPSKVRP